MDDAFSEDKPRIEFRNLSNGRSCYERVVFRTSESRQRVEDYLRWTLDSNGRPKPPLDDCLEVESLRIRDKPEITSRWVWSEPSRLSFRLGKLTEIAVDLELRPGNRLGMELEHKVLGLPFSRLFGGWYMKRVRQILGKPKFRHLNPAVEGRRIWIDVESQFPDVRMELTEIRVVGSELIVEGTSPRG